MKIINILDYITPNLYTEAYVNELKEEITTKDKELLQLRQRIDKAIEVINAMIHTGYTLENNNTATLFMAVREKSEFGIRAEVLLEILKGEYNNV